MAQAHKPNFVFRRNRRVHLNRPGASFQSTTGRRGVCISGSNAGYTMCRGSVKGTGYPLHSPDSPSLPPPPLPCVTLCHHISTGLYPNNHRLITLVDQIIAYGPLNLWIALFLCYHVGLIHKVSRHATRRHVASGVNI